MSYHRKNKSGQQFAEIRDPVHGYIYANETEREIIDTKIFQRLRRIRQLAGCHLVYPGGQHSRFEHSIGAMHLAGNVNSVLASRNVGFTSTSAQELRAAALLHDIGHGPFSHMFEEVMAERSQVNHEDMTQKIILGTEIGDILERNGISRRELSKLAVGKSDKKRRYENDVIGGGLSVDIMDYLLRDSYFTGVEYGKVDALRIINSFEVVKDRLAIGHAALFAFEALMIARYEMFRAVYFHRTVRAAELMLVEAMILSDKVLHLTDISLERYLSLTDEVTLDRIKNMNADSDSELRRAKKLASDYEKRNLLKCVFEKIVQRKDKFLNSIFNQKSFRKQLSEKIAEEAKINPQDVYVDVPTAPSVPISSAREAFTQIFVARRLEKGRISSYPLNIEDMPLIGKIIGFMDVVRIYTTAVNRKKAELAVQKIFGREGFESMISM